MTMNEFDLIAAQERVRSEISGALLSIHSYKSVEPNYFARMKAAISDAAKLFEEDGLVLRLSCTKSRERPKLFGMKRPPSSNCEVDRAIGRAQGWRCAPPPPAAAALTPSAHRSWRTAMRSVGDRARKGALIGSVRSGWDPISAVVRSGC